MNRFVCRGLFFVLTGLSLTACQRSGSDNSPVVAEVGKYKVTMDDLKARLDETPAAYQQYVASAEGRRQFLNLLIREKVLLAEAHELGIQNDPTFKQTMDKFKVEWRRRLKEYEETLLVESALRRLRSKEVAVTDTEVEKYYDDHRDEYEKPMEISASHILVGSEQEANAVLARLNAGDSFETVAREMSKDPATAVRGGRLAPFRRGTLVPEVEDAAFKLKVGQVSGIVKSQFGFHIIKKLGEKQLPPQPLAEVKDEIRAKLERDKFNEWVTAKQSVLGVKVNESAMASLTQESSKP